MDDEQYAQTQGQIMLLASALLALDLDGFLARIGRAHALAPILDPTLYRDGVGNLTKIEDVARALRQAQASIRAVAEGRGSHG